MHKLSLISLLAAAMILFSGSIAQGTDLPAPISSHGWMVSPPGISLSPFTNINSNRLKKYQTLYWALTYKSAGNVGEVVNTTTNALEECSGDADDCTSAALFIESNDAVICMDSDITSATAGGNTKVNMNICSDETCVGRRKLNTTPFGDSYGWCTSFGENPPGGENPDSSPGPFGVGGLWVYLHVTTPLPNQPGETTLFWITGQ